MFLGKLCRQLGVLLTVMSVTFGCARSQTATDRQQGVRRLSPSEHMQIAKAVGLSCRQPVPAKYLGLAEAGGASSFAGALGVVPVPAAPAPVASPKPQASPVPPPSSPAPSSQPRPEDYADNAKVNQCIQKLKNEPVMKCIACLVVRGNPNPADIAWPRQADFDRCPCKDKSGKEFCAFERVDQGTLPGRGLFLCEGPPMIRLSPVPKEGKIGIMAIPAEQYPDCMFDLIKGTRPGSVRPQQPASDACYMCHDRTSPEM